jgi:ribosome-associated protein
MSGETHLRITPHLSIPFSELLIRTSRSGGPGGQHVNKVETKVELQFDVVNSPTLSPEQRQLVLEHLAGEIDSSGNLRITEQRSRSQYQNKELVLNRFAEILRHALKPVRHRVPTKPTKASKNKRVESKRKAGEKKRLRRIQPEEG